MTSPRDLARLGRDEKGASRCNLPTDPGFTPWGTGARPGENKAGTRGDRRTGGDETIAIRAT